MRKITLKSLVPIREVKNKVIIEALYRKVNGKQLKKLKTGLKSKPVC